MGDNAKGSYHVLLADGRTLTVDYIADKDGFQPKLKYEGTAKAAPSGGGKRGGGGGGGGSGGRGGGGNGGADGYDYPKPDGENGYRY